MIGNLVAGQSLAFRRAFKVGDRIKIGDHVGEVAQIRLLTTYLRSPKNEQIVIPNSTILNTEVVNFSALAQGEGTDSPYHCRDRLRNALAAGGGHAAGGRSPDTGTASAAAAVRAADGRWERLRWITSSTPTATVRT